MDAVAHRRKITGLAEQFLLEFAGTMPPGQILGVVHQVNHLVLHSVEDAQAAIVLCEAISRRIISERALEIRRREKASA